MTLTQDIKTYIDKSVLCWLATASTTNIPNVSPKEVFTYFGDDSVIIANIASPQSVKNIKANPEVCVSFIDVFVQKGYQLKGQAAIISNVDHGFPEMEKVLLKITEGQFPFSSITKIRITSSKPIIAPKYILYPGTTEQQQIESAKKTYGV
ncbi:pyridoxamine 5'-phosphate oxidase family protein [Tamlana sp. 2201CG12-4]|uniref:pyridoxamine 5'-phosphate oxidase family protein n=1 Tax=Tamlana sp. 2201CG12-4 TaxID=3112582 RepID=UPI002DBD0D4C|nr:pyridoxamine 5'-phosphate oxidase family protein [Tamlana sp. 2201CG12-4]MEC3906066.1 pyridoxamine 5'-phosphate oxidase family protein [Tamlana sp. 2201CG12-4]